MKKNSTFLQAAGYFFSRSKHSGVTMFRIIGGSIFAATLTIFSILPKLVFAQQTDIPRGMIMFGDAKAVYGQMRDSLGINWVQGYTGVANEHIGPDTNTVGFKVISIRANLNSVSTAQHMEYEAARKSLASGDWTYNYFSSRPAGVGSDVPDASVRDGRFQYAHWSVKGLNSPGYMVSNAVPDSEFHYGHTNYIATFRLKIDDKSNPSWNVVTLHVKGLDNNRNVLYDSIKTLTEDSFTTTNTYQIFRKSFTIPQQAGTQHVDVKAGRPHVMTATPAVSHIDISVYWYGNVNTWLDYVDVDDDVSLNLFAGGYDATIANEVNDYLTGFPLMQRLYLRDEPFVPSFLPYHYVDTKLNGIFGQGSLRGRGITETFWAQNSIIFNRFLQEAQPCETIYESGPLIDADIPSPSFRDAYYQDLIDDWQGVAPYVSDADYISKMQTQFNNVIDANFKVAAELTRSNSVQFWFSPHLDGSFHRSTGQYRWTKDPYHWRPPTAIELRALVNTALAYGAKAVLAYPYTGNPEQTAQELFFPGLVSQALSPDGLKRNHWSNIESISCWNNNDSTSLYSENVYTGYSEKWDELSALNKRLGLIGPTLASIAWQGTKSWGTGLSAGTWAGKISNVTTNISGETVYVETGHFVDGNGNNYFYVVNRRTLASEGRNITVNLAFPSGGWDISDVTSGNAWIISAGASFTDSFAPGEGKLYKVIPANYTGARTVPAGATMTINDAPITFQIGSSLVVSGTLVCNSNLVIPSGATMIVNAGGAVKFSSAKTVTVHGVMHVNGTSSQRVSITSTGSTSPGSWGLISLSGSGASGSTLTYANISYGTEIDVTSANNVIIQYCNITNNSGTGIYLYSTSGCMMYSNTITNSNVYHGILITAGSSNNCYQNVI